MRAFIKKQGSDFLFTVAAEIESDRPIRLTQFCTQFKPFGNKTFRFRIFHTFKCECHILYANYNTQRILTPGDLNWVQHGVSRIGVLWVM